MGRHFVDLNIPYSGPLNATKLSPILEDSHRLGYCGVALNYIATTPLKSKDACQNVPVPLSGEAGKAPSLDLVASLSAHYSDTIHKSNRKNVKRSRKEYEEASAKAEAGSSSSPVPSKSAGFVQLSRITVQAKNYRAATDIYAASPVLSSYDIVAVSPGDLDIAKHAIDCSIVDILALDMAGGKLPFMITKDLVDRAIDKGVVFEIEYAPAIRDATCRRFFIGNCLMLLRLTRGNNIILTSGAEHALELRSPRDVCAIVRLAGLPPEQAMEAMSRAAARVLARAEQRKTHRGILMHHVAPQKLPSAVTAAAEKTDAKAPATGAGHDKAEKLSQGEIIKRILTVKGESSLPPWTSTPAARGVLVEPSAVKDANKGKGAAPASGGKRA